jgi:poly-gamma-glutamate capsule biosynthesis protein CapA/YwtB (metallophosphatase superfamily)
MRIGLLGDVMLGRGVGAELAKRDPQDLWAPELRELCQSLDLVICNLECCISSRGHPTERIPGKPFFFRGPPRAIEALRAINLAAVGLANNHALDYETSALEDTLHLLPAAGIAVAGAGSTDAEAHRGAVLEVAGRRIGLLAASDHPQEFAAGPDEPGIAYAHLRTGVPDWLASEIDRLDGECDLVVALLHWGPNMTTAPEKRNRQAASELQRLGVDLIAGHSAHVFHGAGWTRRGPILYDLGDALDDYARDADLRNDLGLLAIWTPAEGGGELELVGLRLDYCFTSLAVGDDAAWIEARLRRACADLGTEVDPASDTLARWRIRRSKNS